MLGQPVALGRALTVCDWTYSHLVNTLADIFLPPSPDHVEVGQKVLAHEMIGTVLSLDPAINKNFPILVEFPDTERQYEESEINKIIFPLETPPETQNQNEKAAR